MNVEVDGQKGRYLCNGVPWNLRHPETPLFHWGLRSSDIGGTAIAGWLVSRSSRPLALRGGRAAGLCIRVRVYEVNYLSASGRSRTENIIQLIAGSRPGLSTCSSRGGLVACASRLRARLDAGERPLAVVLATCRGGISLLTGDGEIGRAHV